MKELKLTLTVDETNLILEGLGNLPFARVCNLIARVQEQAVEQLEDETIKQPDGSKSTSPGTSGQETDVE